MGDLRMQRRRNKKDVLHPESEDVCMYPLWFHVFKSKELCINQMKLIKYADQNYQSLVQSKNNLGKD